MLDIVISQLASKISRNRGYTTPYNLIIKPELPRDSKDRERIVIIKAGYPPTIILSKLYIEACVELGKKNGVIPELRDTIERSLEYLPRMQHTLAIVPIADAISLRKDSRKWAKSLVPELRTVLDDKYFEVTYQVTVREVITNTSVVRNCSKEKDLEDTIKKAKFDLSKIVIATEENEEIIEMITGKDKTMKKEVNPNEIGVAIIVGNGKVETSLEY